MLLAMKSPLMAEVEPVARAKEIRTLMGESFGEEGPGAAILVSHHGKPVHLSGFGMADIGKGEPVTPDSMFDLASVSKQFTATGILCLAENDQLDLDAKISVYLPDYAVPVKRRPVTVADLLHHVSGLADYCGDEWSGTDEEFARLTPETHLKWLNTTEPRRKPGIKYEYNNTGYVLLALIVERISGENFASYLHDNLFQPESE